MRIGVGSAVVLLGVALHCYADPVAIGPGQTVVPGMSGFGGSLVGSTSGSVSGGQITYQEMVYADPMNPICIGCYDFMLFRLGNGSTSTEITGATLGGISGGPFTFAVGYTPADPGNGGYVAPTSATEDAAGDAVTFAFRLYFPQTVDPLILYSSATAFEEGELSVATSTGNYAGLPLLVPAAAPEPGSLVLMGTGLLGLVASSRRRLS